VSELLGEALISQHGCSLFSSTSHKLEELEASVEEQLFMEAVFITQQLCVAAKAMRGEYRTNMLASRIAGNFFNILGSTRIKSIILSFMLNSSINQAN